MRSATQVRSIKDPIGRYRAADDEAKAHRAEAKALHQLKCEAVVELRESGLKWREISEKLGPNPGACVNLAAEVESGGRATSAPKSRSRRKLAPKPRAAIRKAPKALQAAEETEEAAG